MLSAESGHVILSMTTPAGWGVPDLKFMWSKFFLLIFNSTTYLKLAACSRLCPLELHDYSFKKYIYITNSLNY